MHLLQDYYKQWTGNDSEEQVSFSSTFYEQLLLTQIPKAQKDSYVKPHVALSGSECVKAEHKNVDEIYPRTSTSSGRATIQSRLRRSSTFVVKTKVYPMKVLTTRLISEKR